MATGSKKLVLLALVANSLIAVIKFVAAAISSSSAMLAEAFHSVADSGNQLFLLRGEVASRYSADVQHPFGRGKESYFWGFMVAVFLFVGGSVVAVLEGFERIRHPEAGEPGGFIFSLAVLAIAAAFEGVIALRPALKEFNRRRAGRSVIATVREGKDPSLIVVLFEDTAAMVGLTLAAAGIITAEVTGEPRWDGVASILIGVLLAAVAFVLAFEMKALLVGEAASRRERSLIRAAALAVPEVESIGRLWTMQLSPHEILVNMEIDMRPGLIDNEVEATIDQVEIAVREAVPTATRIFVELESRT